ncbi:MAG: DMT family transporter [Acidimicrobiales bacterium]
MPEQHRVTAALATTLLLWSLAFVFIRIAVEHFSVPGLTLSRLLVASAALAVAAPVLKVRAPGRADLPRLAVCALTGMTGYQLLLNAGERTIDAGTANLLVNTGPVFAAVLAWAVLAERPTPRVWAGMGLGFSGATILALAHDGGIRPSADALLVLGAAACQATFFVLQKPLLSRYSSFEVTCYATWAAGLMMLPAAGRLADDLPDLDGGAVASLLFLGIGSSAAAYATWAYALGRIDVAIASNTLYLAPPLTIVIGWVALDETPTPLTLIGGLVVLGGVATTARARHRQEPEPQQTVAAAPPPSPAIRTPGPGR